MADQKMENQLPIDGSGARNLVGYRSLILDDDIGACELDVGPQHLNRLGQLHGGFVAMLLDNACGVTVRNTIGNVQTAIITVSMSVNFLAGVRSGSIMATGRVTGGGNHLKFVDAELKDESGRLLATASAVFRVLGKS